MDKQTFDSKRGISTILVTVIMIALVLAAVAIVWVIFNNLLTEKSSAIGFSSDCLDIGLTVTKLTNTVGSTYNVTIKRSSTGKDLGGVKMVLYNTTINSASSVIDSTGNIAPLATVTKTVTSTTTLVGANKIELTPYLLNEGGGQEPCNTVSFSF